MKQNKVFKAIKSERYFQDHAVKSGGTHIVKEFPLGSALSAIQHKLDEARKKWYGAVTPHKEAMEELRKIAAICVQMGEVYGMPMRDNPSHSGDVFSMIPVTVTIETPKDVIAIVESVLPGETSLVEVMGFAHTLRGDEKSQIKSIDIG